MAERVAVVGGGIVGIACAHYLSQAGHAVTVIDQGRIGSGCSHGNCGHIYPSHVLPLNERANLFAALGSLVNPRAPFRVRPQWRPALLRWFWEFARRCNHRHAVVADRAMQPILDASTHEYRRLFETPESRPSGGPSGCSTCFRPNVAWCGSPPRTGCFATPSALPRGGWKAANCRCSSRRCAGSCQRVPLPRRCLSASRCLDGELGPLARVTRRGVRGASPGAGCRNRNRRITRLITDAGDLTAERYVFASGAWSAAVAADLGCPVPIEPGKGYSITTTRPQTCPRHAMLFAEHRVGATPFDDGFRLGSMMEFSGFDATIPARRIRQLINSARHYLHEPAGELVLETWCGWRPMTWDSLPVIGAVPGRANGVLATGHHMLGVTMAPATGRLVAEIIGERAAHIDPAPFSPARFS